MTATLISLLLLCLDLTAALRISATGQQGRRSHRRNLKRDASATSVLDQNNTQYVASITMGGAPFEVMIDTGSSDLWIQKPVPNSQNTQFTATVQYAVGQVTGPVAVAETSFSGFTVKNQAFIAVPPGGNADAGDSDGLIGLGPASGSVILQSVGSSAGDPFLDNVFRQDTSSSNFITVQLSRNGDSGTSVQGEFSIGSLAQGFESVTSMPKLAVSRVPVGSEANQHWMTDVDAILGFNGQKISVSSTVPTAKSGKLVAVYDSGFTFPQVPPAVSDALYSGIPGAQFISEQGFWAIPCDTEVNLTFVIGGQNYPMHPFDTNMDMNFTDDNNKPICIGAFQPMSTDTGGLFDMILGMAFLRNAYMLINFGDFVDGNPDHQGDPYMQLLSVTDPAKAHNAFVESRLNGHDTTGTQPHPTSTPSDNGASPSTTNTSSTSNKAKSFLKKNLPYIAAVAGGLALLILGGCIWSCARKRRSASYGVISGPYRPLNDPAPAPAMELQGGHQTYSGQPYGGYPGQQSYPYTGGAYQDPYYNRP